MIRNPVKEALLNRKPSFGSWVQIGHPAVAEILSNVGFDWIAVDCEHTDIELNGFTELARAMYGRDVVPLVRVRENDDLAIRQVLDMGAGGVIVPLVNSAGEARKAVSAAKFPPRGTRGFSFCRSNDWGENFEDYVRETNDDTAVVVMIESREAVEDIDTIVAVDGVDGVFIGPYDLSGSYGCVGDLSHRDVVDAHLKIAESCRRAGKSAGLHIVTPDEAAIIRAVDAGFTFIALGMDSVFLRQGARSVLRTAREASK